jgi:hypothetical protein
MKITATTAAPSAAATAVEITAASSVKSASPRHSRLNAEQRGHNCQNNNDRYIYMFHDRLLYWLPVNMALLI